MSDWRWSFRPPSSPAHAHPFSRLVQRTRGVGLRLVSSPCSKRSYIVSLDNADTSCSSQTTAGSTCRRKVLATAFSVHVHIYITQSKELLCCSFLVCCFDGCGHCVRVLALHLVKTNNYMKNIFLCTCDYYSHFFFKCSFNFCTSSFSWPSISLRATLAVQPASLNGQPIRSRGHVLRWVSMSLRLMPLPPHVHLLGHSLSRGYSPHVENWGTGLRMSLVLVSRTCYGIKHACVSESTVVTFVIAIIMDISFGVNEDTYARYIAFLNMTVSGW